jgi:hypothetical protein
MKVQVTRLVAPQEVMEIKKNKTKKTSMGTKMLVSHLFKDHQQ